jgi:hypothetical protein
MPTRNSQRNSSEEDGVCWRGGGFNMDHQGFFTQLAAETQAAQAQAQPQTQLQAQYRVPAFLATSARKAATNSFRDRAQEAGFPVVQWKFEFDKRGDPRGDNDSNHRCKHINKLRVTHHPNEDEFLFQAYSAFAVLSADFSTAGTAAEPYCITLSPAVDNKEVSEALPLAPWY